MSHIQNIWIPQFSVPMGSLEDESQMRNFIVEESEEEGALYVQDCLSIGAVELYSPPIDEGSLIITPNKEDSFVVAKPFIMAMTHNLIEDGFEVPYLAANVKEVYWKKL